MKFSKNDTVSLFEAMFKVEKALADEKLVKESKAYGYKYANLATVFDLLKPALRDAGLIITQGGDNGDFRGDVNTATVTTYIIHVESGEWLSTQMTIPLNKSTPQDYGSAVTYARRYSLLSLFGLVAEDDDASPIESDKRASVRAERETRATEYKSEKLAQEQVTIEKEASDRVRQPRGSKNPTTSVSEAPQASTGAEPAEPVLPKTNIKTLTDSELAAMEPKDEVKAGEIKVPVRTSQTVTGVPKIEPYNEEQFKPLPESVSETEVKSGSGRTRPVRK